MSSALIVIFIGQVILTFNRMQKRKVKDMVSVFYRKGENRKNSEKNLTHKEREGI